MSVEQQPLCGLTGARRLFGGRQGHLGEREDVDVRPALGGRRGQRGHVCVVLVPVRIFELLEDKNTDA